MEFVDYYAELGLKREATADEIKKAYRRLAKQYHPDHDPSPKAQARIRAVNEAYEVLGDAEKRKKYDQFGKNWQAAENAPGPGFEDIFQSTRRGRRGPRATTDTQAQQGGTPAGFSDFFDMLFGRGGQAPAGFGGAPGGFSGMPEGFGGTGFAPNLDLEVKLVLSLEDAIQGGEREVALGSDAARRSFRINVPKGVKPGQKIRLKGQGHKGQGGTVGDLLLVIEHTAHPRFRLDGEDLYTELWVAPWTAALGGEAHLQTLDGDVKIKVPPASSTGRKIRLRGKGFPRAEGRGDLYAEVRIAVPAELSDEERLHFEALAKVSSFDPSAA